RDIDLVSRKHSRNPLSQPCVVGELEQKPESLVGNPILRVIELDAYGGRGQTFAASRVVREKLAQVQLLYLLVMRCERLPGGPPDQRWFPDRWLHSVDLKLNISSRHLRALANRGALGLNHAHQLVPRFDERLGPVILQLGRQCLD